MMMMIIILITMIARLAERLPARGVRQRVRDLPRQIIIIPTCHILPPSEID